MSTASKVIALTERQTDRYTHTRTHTHTMKTLPLPHMRYAGGNETKITKSHCTRRVYHLMRL